MKLALKIISMMVFAVVAVTAISSYFTSRQFVESIEERHREIADSLANLRKDAEFHRSLNNRESLYLLKTIKNATDKQTQVRWSWILQETNIYADGEVLSRKTLRRTLPNGEIVLATYCPIKSGDRHGFFQISSSLDSINDQAWKTWQTGLISIGAISLCAISVVVIGGVRMIGQPLEKLTRKIDRIGQGNLDSDLELTSNDELAQLGDALNRMCDQLRIQQTQIREEAEKRIQTLEQLRHADRLKTVGQLAAGFAHEVGTPLNVVSARADMILDDDATADEIKKHVAEIKSETTRINGLVRKLLEFSRRGESNRAIQDLRSAVTSSASLIQPILEKQNLNLELDLPDQPALANFDLNQFQQVFINLIDNAIDASPKDATISVSVKRENENWLLQVKDDGEGMDSSQLEKAFEPFFTTKDVGKGTGLGLSIVYGIVEEHGGDISVESGRTRGTTVSIRLPNTELQKDAG